jgi:hypothetical protein
MGKKVSKATIKKGHRIARGIQRSHAKNVRNAYAVGMAQAMGTARRRRK